MTSVLRIHRTALRLHKLARDSVLPAYAEKLEQAALDLDMRVSELRHDNALLQHRSSSAAS